MFKIPSFDYKIELTILLHYFRPHTVKQVMVWEKKLETVSSITMYCIIWLRLFKSYNCLLYSTVFRSMYKLEKV